MSNDTHSCGLDTAAICAACTKTPVDGNQLGAVPDLGKLVDWVWSLKAEVEALRESDQESTELRNTLSALLGQIAVAVRGPEDPLKRHGFADLPSRVKAVVTDRDQLKAFAVEMINASFEGGSFDGGDIQDIAVKHGLLWIEQREDECGEGCACREYGFPAECYRKTPILGAVTDEVTTQSTDNENVSRHDRR